MSSAWISPARQAGSDLLDEPAVVIRVAERDERAVTLVIRCRARYPSLGPRVVEHPTRVTSETGTTTTSSFMSMTAIPLLSGCCWLHDRAGGHSVAPGGTLPLPWSRPGDRTGREQDEQPVRVAHGRHGYRSVWCRLGDAPRRAAQSESGQPVSVVSTSTKNDSSKNPVLGGDGGGSAGTSPSNTLSSRTPAWSSGTRASPRKTARKPRLGASSNPGQSPSTCRSCSRSRPIRRGRTAG